MVLKLNIDNFMKLQKKNNLNMTEISNLLGVSRSHLWRILNDHCNPGEQFIAGFKKAFPNESFDNFFSVKMLQQNDTKVI